MRSKLTPDQHKTIIQRYLSGDHTTLIARDLGVTHGAIAYHLRKHQIALHPTSHRLKVKRKRVMTFEQRDEAIERLKKGVPLTTLAADYGVSWSSFRHHRIVAGIGPRTSRKKTVDEHVFDTATPESAYWIGFLMADGSVSDQGFLTLGLSIKDAKHVEKFRDFLRSNHKLSVNGKNGYSQTTAVYLRICSRTLCQALATYGVIPRKSLHAKVIGLDNNRDFWRGMIDGDGSIGEYYGYKTNIYPQISLCGSPEIIEQFEQYTKEIAPTVKAIPRKHGKIDTFTVRGTNAVVLLKHLYAEANTALDRKLALALKLIEKHS